MIKKTVKSIFLLILSILLVFFYLKNDGLYVINKLTATELELINKYTTIEFSETTVVEEFAIVDDLGIPFIYHSEAIEATLLVPNDAINDLFPEYLRDYEEENILNLSENEEERVQFGVWIPQTVVKWLDKTQRTINITVMESSGIYTKVYLLVDNLGWNLWR